MKTTMSNPSLPPEILDYIVDNLRDEPYALRNCRLVAKSWIPRARKHFFANIKFFSPERLESWKKTFPDPSNSPAYHARTLSVKCPHVVTAEDGGEDGWVRTFSRVVRLDVDSSVLCPNDSETFLAPFHGFSPVLKSLRVASTVLPLSRILGLVRSLPLLEDLTLIIYGIPGNDGFSARGPPIPIPPSNSPPLTGTLGLDLPGGAEITVSRLLSLPNGLHFRRITLVWFRKDDIRWINDLIAGCSNTLETLDIKRRLFDNWMVSSIDLSKATRLKDIRLWCGQPSAKWIVMVLQTITSKHRDLRKISFHIPYRFTLDGPGANIRRTFGEVTHGQWLDLDRVLVRLWESHSIRPTITYAYGSEDRRKEGMDCVSHLLPEVMKRGIADLEKYRGPQQTSMS